MAEGLRQVANQFLAAWYGHLRHQSQRTGHGVELLHERAGLPGLADVGERADAPVGAGEERLLLGVHPVYRYNKGPSPSAAVMASMLLDIVGQVSKPKPAPMSTDASRSSVPA